MRPGIPVFTIARACVLCLAGWTALGADPPAPEWSQFRGPNGSGIALAGRPPTVFNLKQNLRWSVNLPGGHSSPAVWKDRIFLTAFDPAQKKFEVIALDASGKMVWRHAVAAPAVEKVHELNHPASATPATDGQRVYVYFGSYGLLALDLDGKEVWSLPLPLPKMSFGSGTSPVVVDGRVILSRDEQEKGYLLAVNAADGKEIWRQNYSAKARFGAYATPVIANGLILIHRTGETAAFHIEDGKPAWTAQMGGGTSVPVMGDGRVYISNWSPFGEADHMPPLPTYDQLLQKDANSDGKISEAEFPDDAYLFKRPNIEVTGSSVALKSFFARLDANNDGVLDKGEWETISARLASARQSPLHGLVALGPDGKMIWRESRSVPEVPSPLFSRGRVYMVSNGGIVTCMDGADGKVLYRGRLGAAGAYFSSPVAAGDHIYFASHEGVVTAIKDSGTGLEVAAKNELGEPIFATPAFLKDLILVRTGGHLYAFGK